ncbi:hypothetical protein EFT51_13580, partial [Lactococcus lactis]|nr:DUF1660 domain-containing protein [Lactococcus lactis]MCT3086153.1 hypothetical protein [Lactococcus lactis]
MKLLCKLFGHKW